MRYIALEEHFTIPELAEQWPSAWGEGEILFSNSFVADVERRLPDFTEYRLKDMDAAGIDVQVLSHTVPGVQADVDAATARDHAQFANDHLAGVVAEHPDRFRGFAVLPTQDPRAAAEELGRCVNEFGFCGRSGPPRRGLASRGLRGVRQGPARRGRQDHPARLT
jgi:2,3-dihydroxybenzoate decarboxylase